MTSKTFYIETYGCQMNFADSEIVNSILIDDGMRPVAEPEQADLILVNTCSIRENAESKIWKRLTEFRKLKASKKDVKVGVLGCMAERIRDKIIEKEQLVDLVVGPDAYRDLPNLISDIDVGHKAVNVILSQEETYADITPVRTTGNGVTAYISIMRGCDNMCSFCVVPFTRGRERSRPLKSILGELRQLSEDGYRDVTLLGQNVNSYLDDNNNSFTDLMAAASELDTETRIRFSTSHPKDFPDELLHLIYDRPNICSYIHIPAQSGNDMVLERMRRPYTRSTYLELINKMRTVIPGVSLSTDFITGFCGETEEQHQDTLSLIKEVRYDLTYMFAYSERERTMAYRSLDDDIPEEVKKRRLTEMIDLQREIQAELNREEIGRHHLVLVEGTSKRSDSQLSGRTDTNKIVVFDRQEYNKGDYVEVEITDSTSATLIGKPVCRSSIQHFYNRSFAISD